MNRSLISFMLTVAMAAPMAAAQATEPKLISPAVASTKAVMVQIHDISGHPGADAGLREQLVDGLARKGYRETEEPDSGYVLQVYVNSGTAIVALTGPSDMPGGTMTKRRMSRNGSNMVIEQVWEIPTDRATDVQTLKAADGDRQRLVDAILKKF